MLTMLVIRLPRSKTMFNSWGDISVNFLVRRSWFLVGRKKSGTVRFGYKEKKDPFVATNIVKAPSYYRSV